MTDTTSESEESKSGQDDDVTANPQPTGADKPPIPQPPTDGFPTGGEDLTSRVPGGPKDLTKKEEE